MGRKRTGGTRDTFKAMKTRVFAVSAVVFTAFLIIFMAGFSISMRNFNRQNADERLNSTLKTLTLGLARAVNSELTLAAKMADTPAIRNFFLDPSDEALERTALEEFSAFESHFENQLVFWVNDIDKMFHSTGAAPYKVDPDDPDNYWYNMTLYDTPRYNLNINWNPDLQAINLWVNIPVFDAGGRPIGMLGTGIDLREFTALMSQLAKDIDRKIEFYIFNTMGEITEAANYELVADKTHIDAYIGEDILVEAMNLPEDGTAVFSRGNTRYAVHLIPELDWFVIGGLEVSPFFADDPMINYLFAILIVVILIITIIFNVSVARYTDYMTVQAENLVDSEKKRLEAKTDAESAAKEKNDFIDTMSRAVRDAVNEIMGTLKLVALQSDLPGDVTRLIDDAGASGRALLRVFGGGEDEGGAFASAAKKEKRRVDAGMHHFFVINPKSFVSNNELKNFLLAVEKCFSVGHRAEYKTYISRYPRDAKAAVHRYVESVPENETVRVYAVGGDGIAFDCLNGLARFKNAEIATIPYGNANDICRSFGVEHLNDFRDIKMMSRAPSRPMDVIKCGSAFAMAGCSIGIESMAVARFAKIIAYFDGSSWRRLVPLLYKLGAVISVLEGMAHAPEYRLKIDGEEIVGRFTLINVGNIGLNGGENIPNPLAKPNDGLLDIIVSINFTRSQALRALPYYTSGRYQELGKWFTHYTCKEFECESDEQMYVVLDGENYFTNKISLKIVPDGVKIVAPNGINFADYSAITKEEGKKS